MKFGRVLLACLLITSSFIASAKDYGVYYSELKALKKNPATKEIFDKDAHSELAAIQRDIAVYKNLTPFQRWVRKSFLECDVVIVTAETLPKLYAYVDDICKKAKIATPIVFITRQDGFYNAAAQKLLMSSGAIIVGQKLMHDSSDEALEAIVAHEIGHIKHNHGNKGMAIGLGSLVILLPVLIKYFKLDKLFREIAGEIMTIEAIESVTVKESFDLMNKINVFRTKLILILIGVALVPAAIINKRFEKEADEFACKDNDKAEGLIESFEFTLKKEALREEEFVAIYNLLQDNKANLTFLDYYNDLIFRYYLARFHDNINKVRKYIYYNTFYGAHPSPQARIATAKKYLQQEA